MFEVSDKVIRFGVTGGMFPLDVATGYVIKVSENEVVCKILVDGYRKMTFDKYGYNETFKQCITKFDNIKSAVENFDKSRNPFQ